MEFIQKYVRVDDDFDQEFIDDDEVILDEQVSDCECIDDLTEFDNQQASNYFFKSVERNLEEASLDEFEDSDTENYCQSKFKKSEIDYDIFDNFEKRIEKFKSELKIFKKYSKYSLYNAVFYALIFKLTDKKEFVTNEIEIQSIIGTDTLEKLKKLKSKLFLNLLLTSFERHCFDTNDLLQRNIFSFEFMNFIKNLYILRKNKSKKKKK